MFAFLRVERLSSMQQMVLVLVFLTVMSIIIYINVFSPESDTLLNINLNYHSMNINDGTQMNLYKPWRRLHRGSNNIRINHPSLIIIGSVNGGTSLLNELYAFFLKSFNDDFKKRDIFYWKTCIPCDQFLNKTDNHYDWNVSLSNLCHITNSDKLGNDEISKDNKQTLKYQWAKTIKHHKLKRAFSSNSNNSDNNNNKIAINAMENGGHCTINDYIKTIIILNKYRHSLNGKDLYSAERCSGYNYVPSIAKIIANLFPETVILYAIREKASQQYSRAKNFHKTNNKRISKKDAYFESTEYFNHQFKNLLNIVESDKVQNGLLPLLKMNGNMSNIEDIRMEIVEWYIHYGGIGGKQNNYPIQKDLRDMCPYVNVLLYMKMLEIYNGINGYYKLRIIQSEWLYQDILRSARFVHCIVSVKNVRSELEMTECDRYYEDKQHMMEIMSIEDQMKLMNNSYGKKKKYEYNLSDMDTFDKLVSFWTICDLRLFELIQQYPSLTLGTRWDNHLWISIRESMRNAMVEL